MSTKVIRSMSDFSRFRVDIDVRCYCGHKNTLPYWPVLCRFIDKGWPKNLHSALDHFRCTKCGSCAQWIGPLPR